MADEARPEAPAVGFAACPAEGGRLLRVRVASRTQRRLAVDCPHCAARHSTLDCFARELRPDEPVPELVALPDDPDPGSGRRQVSDAAILEGTPTDDTPATKIAAALGYAETASLLRRLRSMNQRAEEADEPVPFVLTRAGRDMLVRRTIDKGRI